LVVHLGQKVHLKRIAITTAQAMRFEGPRLGECRCSKPLRTLGQAQEQAFAATCIGGSPIGFAFAREAR
jgi:hypothetical protein